MGIDFNINITRKIKVNGQEYGSIDDVPPEHRDTVRKALGMAGPASASMGPDKGAIPQQPDRQTTLSIKSEGLSGRGKLIIMVVISVLALMKLIEILR